MSAITLAKQRLPLPDLMVALGLGDRAKKSALCPLHEDRNPSFGVYLTGGGERAWKCHAGCGGGDGADLIAKLHNISNEACRRYIELAGKKTARGATPPITTRRSRPTTQQETATDCSLLPIEIYAPSHAERVAAMRMAEALVNDAALCERIARRRNWNAETLRELAMECYLGWDAPKLAFIYATGVKVRWRQDGERVIRWAFGRPWIWRGARLHNAQTVYRCESETEAISLIDGGFENDPACAVAAIPFTLVPFDSVAAFVRAAQQEDCGDE